MMKNPKITNSTCQQSKPGRRRKRFEEQSNAVLQEVTSHYLNSQDFNGISVLRLADRLKKPLQDVKAIVATLIETEVVGILDTRSDVNPAIIGLGFEPKEEQLKKLDRQALDHVYVYPRPTHLESVVDPAQYSSRPYVLDLALGQPQLSFRSFDLSVLEFIETTHGTLTRIETSMGISRLAMNSMDQPRCLRKTKFFFSRSVFPSTRTATELSQCF
jgi:hypothetical protein